MSQYVYHCEDCDKEFTQSMHIADAKTAEVVCPHCGSKKLTKKLSVFAAQGGGSTASAPAPQACARPGGCGCVGGRHRH